MASDFEFRHPILRNDEHSPLNEIKKNNPKNQQWMVARIEIDVFNIQVVINVICFL